ncbi:MAG: hypothetical protein QM729_18145 [Solirubrobacterales bacterium]
MRVHRHRRVQLVAEVDDEGFADADFEQRPGDLRRAQRLLEVGGPGAVGPGGELGLALDRHVHHLVAAGRADVPLHRLGGDPVLLRRRAGRFQVDELGGAGARPGDGALRSRFGRRHLRRHGHALGVGVDVDLAFAGADLVPGERAEEHAAAEREEPAPIHVHAHRSGPTSS